VKGERDARLYVIKSPPSHKYDYTGKSGSLKLNDFKSLLLAVNGFSITKDLEWDGLKTSNTLWKPKVTVLVLADNLKSELSTDLVPKKFIEINEDANINLHYLANFYQEKYGDQSFKTFSGAPETFDGLKEECGKDTGSLFYVIKLTGSDNIETSLKSILTALEADCAKANDQDELLVYLLTTKASQRVKRATTDASNNSIAKVAEFYSDQYPAMFNVIFWTSLILVLTIIAIVYNMAAMDPGLDTVIYRMTSQRIKKDQ